MMMSEETVTETGRTLTAEAHGADHAVLPSIVGMPVLGDRCLSHVRAVLTETIVRSASRT
jgi:hypothetical protein